MTKAVTTATRRAISALAIVCSAIGMAPATGSASVATTAPKRILDTRIGLGAPAKPLQPGTVLRLTVAGRPSDDATVVLNLTATNANSDGWVKAWPCDEAVPATSVLNFSHRGATANMLVMRPSHGDVCLSSNAPVALVADLVGWFEGSSTVRGSSPNRLLDTRVTNEPLRPGEERRLRVAGTGGIAELAAAAVLNITVDRPADAGWVVAYPCAQPATGSTVNFGAGEIVANLTLVGLTGGDVCIRSLRAVNIVVDSYGWAPDGGEVKVQAPSRLLDTRPAGGTPYGAVAAGRILRVQVADRAGVPSDASSAFLTVTVANAPGAGFVTAWNCDDPRPDTSMLNTWPQILRSNLTLVELANDGTVCLMYTSPDRSAVDLIVDAVGAASGGPSRAVPPAPSPLTGLTQFSTLAVGAPLPSGADCAGRVRRAPEIRPENATANSTRSHSAASTPRVDGNFTGTTDEIIQWAACKWGIDEDVARAQAAQESEWRMSAAGDLSYNTDPTKCAPGHPISAGQCRESIGIMQVRSRYYTQFDYWGPAQSTAYNLDLAFSEWRDCYDGRFRFLGAGYGAGDMWGCVGEWLTGNWYGSGADEYINAVKLKLATRVWETPDFLANK